MTHSHMLTVPQSPRLWVDVTGHAQMPITEWVKVESERLNKARKRRGCKQMTRPARGMARAKGSRFETMCVWIEEVPQLPETDETKGMES